MALQATQKKDPKYSHLEKVYTEKQEKVKTEKKVGSEIKFKKEEVKIDRNDVIRNLFILVLVGLLSVSGYFLEKFL